MQQQVQQVLKALDQVVLGKSHQIRLAVSCLLAGGHLLIEDLPGMGKTTLSHALANVLSLGYRRVQFTSDMLPADLIGISIFNKSSQSFDFHKGPLFSQLLLADEINRASPKTQSALLEAMAERQISIEGTTYQLPAPFFVIATQNPVDQSGTFPLPESQLDRFMMRISLGYPDAKAEKRMLLEQGEQAQVIASLQALMSVEDLVRMQLAVQQVHVSDPLLDYLLALVNETRADKRYPNPLSPRGTKMLLSAARAWAYIDGRDHVLPEDLQAILPSVAEHRLRSSLEVSAMDSYGLSERLLSQIDPDRAA
ncbi:MoxR family ATPase [Corallincola holothuriorum]|uniref:MoxR family ATPase n=1 Tax=Corallincola holothuriorum TaxID=2282215 RepID=A0A368NKL7_9GAMM|nr:MoxR family ATPase [Corallincola holothuriorum]RCU50315.1 MoxR family ATPase [Corallincola holothuriorum]